MDARLYPPASIYAEPQPLTQPLSVEDTTVTTLKANPSAWAIVAKEIPGMDHRTGSQLLTPHLKLSLESLVTLGVVPAEPLARIAQQFAELGSGR